MNNSTILSAVLIVLSGCEPHTGKSEVEGAFEKTHPACRIVSVSSNTTNDYVVSFKYPGEDEVWREVWGYVPTGAGDLRVQRKYDLGALKDRLSPPLPLKLKDTFEGPPHFSSNEIQADRAGTNRPNDLNKRYAGVWQYPDAGVWIKIQPDGRAFQCRIDKNGNAVRSEGKLVYGDRIEWQSHWWTDKITLNGSKLVLENRYGTFEFFPAVEEMSKACEAPF
jgi:hypothetical protein